MKQSLYNILIPYTDDRMVLFNGISKRFFFISNNNADELEEVMSDVRVYEKDSRYSNLINILKKNGFIVNIEKDERVMLENMYYRYRDSQSYSLLILSTYSCNFSCWYCVQKHNASFLNDIIVKKIYKHIEQYLHTKNISSFHISWFGGEPLLNFEKVKDICRFSKDLCHKFNIAYSNGITTNASLISRDMAKEMRILSFKNFQITIDGDKESHNKTRYNSIYPDSFSTILNNITMLVEEIPNADIAIRFNYTKNNLSPSLPEDVDKIIGKVKQNVKLLFRKVWQEENTIELNKMLRDIIIKFSNMGYEFLHEYDDMKLTSCYVEKRHYNAIFPDGTVDKCSNRDMSLTRGELFDNGNIVWHNTPKEIDINIFSTKSDCYDCRYLPLCLGPCPRSRENVEMTSGIKCVYPNKDFTFFENIKNYVTFKHTK